MATAESRSAQGRPLREGRRHADDLSSATVKDGVLFDVKDLEVYFPIQQGFFKSMVSTEKKFVKAVDRVSFKVMQGEILALVGESGCGKTTTGRTLLRLEDPTGGHILYKGLPVEKFASKTLRAYRKKAQIIFQDPYNSINPKQTIFDIVAEPLEVNDSAPASARRKTASSRRSTRPACGRPPTTCTATRTSSPAGSGSASASPAPRCSSPT